MSFLKIHYHVYLFVIFLLKKYMISKRFFSKTILFWFGVIKFNFLKLDLFLINTLVKIIKKFDYLHY